MYQGILLVVVNIGVMFTSPIQFIMEKAAELIEAKAELAAFTAASALRARQSADVVHARSRQILGRNLSRQLSSVNDKHMEELADLPSRNMSSLRSRSALSPGLQQGCVANITEPANKPDDPNPSPPGDEVPIMRPKLRGQQFNDLSNIPSSSTSAVTV